MTLYIIYALYHSANTMHPNAMSTTSSAGSNCPSGSPEFISGF